MNTILHEHRKTGVTIRLLANRLAEEPSKQPVVGRSSVKLLRWVVPVLLMGFGAAAFGTGLRSIRILTGFARPVGYYPDPTDSTRAFVVQQNGQIKTIKSGKRLTGNFLRLPDAAFSGGGERGLLGLAFHPNYATNGYCFLYYTAPDGSLQISRFKRTTDGSALVYSSRYDIINIPHPTYANHNGGTIRFGPDGYLYLGTGDGGSGNDPNNNAQNLNILLGKIIRIDVDSDAFASTAQNYAIPPTNPFAGSTPGADEIWAYGVRNPFKFSFDKANGAMYIADVGQSNREEIDKIPLGQGGMNFGWRAIEGTQDNPANNDAWPPNNTMPWFDYSHAEGQCITGGYVYRASILRECL